MNTVYSGKHALSCSAGERGVCGKEVGDRYKNRPENQTKEYIMGIHSYSFNVLKQSSKNKMSL